MTFSLLSRVLFGACFSGACLFAQGASAPSGVDLKAIDRSVDPCQNFYQFACGNWVKSNPVPPEYSRWGRFNELQDRNLEVLRQIAEDSAAHIDRSGLDREIGTFYGSCMNEHAIEKAGAGPVEPELHKILNIQDKAQLAAEVARLHEQQIDVLFRFAASPDPVHSSITIATIDQSGLGLREKGFYVRTDAKSEETRKKYVEHISKVLQLLGHQADDADAKAKAILAFETALAKASLSNVERRNPQLTHNEMNMADFAALAPNFDFQGYFSSTSSPSFFKLNVRVPAFFKGLNQLIASTDLEGIKTYLSWHYVSAYAPELSSSFVNANFDFYSRYLLGSQELQPRWKRCVQLTDRNLGEALGQKYVEKAFGKQAKEKTQELVGVIENQMETDIKSLSWMSDATKQQAIAKLKGVTNKIGYPEKWRDYSSIPLSKNDLVADVSKCREFAVKRELDKIGKPVDRAEFNMTPPTVNAYYSPLENNINFPAGILQPPFYTNTADMAVNFGGIGAVIGHELTHGFDDQGRQYDADGNLRDWWTARDAAEFKKRADCIVDEYSKFSPVEGANINGRLTLGENGADNAGIRLAYMALLGAMENGSVNKEKLDGFTPQQRFFLGNAQIWCANERPDALRFGVQTNPHSPGEFRVIGVVQNVPEFASAFSCSADAPMVAAKGCRVW